MTPIDFLSCLVSDELTRRGERLLERRKKQAEFRDPQKTLDNFDFNFNKKMNRSLVFDLATGAFIARHEDGLFLGPPGTGKSHLAQAIGQAAIQQGYRVLYRETHTLLDDLAEATLDGTRKEHMEFLQTVPLLIIALEHVSVVQQAVEHGADGGRIAEQFAPVSTGRFEVNRVLARS